MRKEEILRLIKETIAKTMLSGAKVILFGPQARGDAREDSDWDILILNHDCRWIHIRYSASAMTQQKKKFFLLLIKL